MGPFALVLSQRRRSAWISWIGLCMSVPIMRAQNTHRYKSMIEVDKN